MNDKRRKKLQLKKEAFWIAMVGIPFSTIAIVLAPSLAGQEYRALATAGAITALGVIIIAASVLDYFSDR